MPNPAYVYENTIRLIIIGSSISFFLVMSFVDMIQTLVILCASTTNRVIYCFKKLHATIYKLLGQPSGAQAPEYISMKQITYESTLIVSNVQMLLMQMTVVAYAVILGYIQAKLDPEASPYIFDIMEGKADELDLSG